MKKKGQDQLKDEGATKSKAKMAGYRTEEENRRERTGSRKDERGKECRVGRGK